VETQQTKVSVALLVQVPRIVRDSAVVTFTARSVDIYFAAYADEAETKLVHYGGGFDLPAEGCGAGINAEESKYNVASFNMVLVLTKKQPAYWEAKGGGMGSGAAEAKGEAVPLPFTLLQPRPFRSKDGTEVRGAPVPFVTSPRKPSRAVGGGGGSGEGEERTRSSLENIAQKIEEAERMSKEKKTRDQEAAKEQEEGDKKKKEEAAKKKEAAASAKELEQSVKSLEFGSQSVLFDLD
jgi:hypothetical protein